MTRVCISIVAAIAFSGVLAAAQGAPQPPDASAKSPAEAPAAAPAPAAPNAPFSYDPAGRRDPFVSLIARGGDANGNRSAGLAGLTVSDVSVKGILRDRSGFIAMLQGPDARTYIVRAGEKLADGAVKSIAADTIVFVQEVTDPLSPVKQREVRKAVRATDGGRD
jgi:type IV pilus assembly protein PilP